MDTREVLRGAWSVVPFVLSLPLLWVAGVRRRSASQPWVIGGHRGRMYEDNAGELHRWVRANTDQRIVWIANEGPVLEQLRAQGHEVAVRNSLAARLLLLRAPVAIYSHGEDDLDTLMLFMRRMLGLRVYLNHSMNVIKAGQVMDPGYRRASALGRWFRRWTMTDFDVLLPSSEHEAANFRRSFPHRADRVRGGGGGAHIDSFLRLRQRTPERVIYYFPTQRDDATGRALLERTLRDLVSNEELRAWLVAGGWTFRVGAHINTGSHALQVTAPFELSSLHNLKRDLGEAAVFISDYSGLTANFLLLDRPLIYFPFDWDNYRQHRNLYEDLETWAAGPLCRDLPSLVATLASEAWADDARWAPRREAWRGKLYPSLEEGYAAASHAAIVALLAPQGTDA